MAQVTEQLVPLPWDTEFFGVSIAQLQLASGDAAHLAHWRQVIADSHYDLVYCFIEDSLCSVPAFQAAIPEALWVDGRICYVRDIHPMEAHGIPNPNLSSAEQMTPELYELAVQNAEFSRFNVDKRLRAGACDELYRIWMEKSVGKTMADEVFIWKDEEGVIRGMNMLRQKNNRMDMGLLAVDTRVRGKGIATQLIIQSEVYALQHGYNQLQLETQQENTPARTLYKKWGFWEESLINIYHIWK